MLDQPHFNAPSGLIVDLFAGPGGWSEGLRSVGLADVGIEWDEMACRTRAAAGHLTIRADVSQYPTEPFVGKTWGLIASPPCTAFSAAGQGAGRAVIGELIDAILRCDWTALRDEHPPTVWLPLEVGRWVEALRPEWIACEQVPAGMPLWDAYRQVFHRWGYFSWAGVLCAADFGVPQTRERAILMASTSPVSPPAATHAERPMAGLFGDDQAPWVSMHDALGWPETWEVKVQRGAGMTERHGDRPNRRADRPAPTIRAGVAGSGPNLTIVKVPS